MTRDSCLVPDGPQPFILMSRGRSGSTSIFQMIGNLTGMEMSAQELPGPRIRDGDRFFQKNRDHKWVLRNLCEKQMNHPEAGVVGFKWKPYESILVEDEALAALRYMGTLTNPQIKVIRSRRNALDVVLSEIKHSVRRGIPPHCTQGDQRCLDRHNLLLNKEEGEGGVTLQLDDLLQRLKEMTDLANSVDRLLIDLNVPHIHVTYDNLYNFNGNDDEKILSEWKRIFNFLGVGPKDSLIRQQLEGSMRFVSTRPYSQKDLLKNYDEVVALLNGKAFQHLLH